MWCWPGRWASPGTSASARAWSRRRKQASPIRSTRASSCPAIRHSEPRLAESVGDLPSAAGAQKTRRGSRAADSGFGGEARYMSDIAGSLSRHAVLAACPDESGASVTHVPSFSSKSRSGTRSTMPQLTEDRRRFQPVAVRWRDSRTRTRPRRSNWGRLLAPSTRWPMRMCPATQTGVPNSIDAGEFVSGYPAISNRDWLKASAIFRQLPALRKRIVDLRAADSGFGGEARVHE